MLQGDKNMFLGFVLPTVAYLKLKLEEVMHDLKVCAPLASALIKLEKILPKEDKTDDDLPSTSSCKNNFFPPKKKMKTQESALDMVERYIKTENLEPAELLNMFPYIKKLFIMFNTTLPSSASVERLFSHAGLIFG
eukprot:00194.XXX_1244_690_1 [CDS] Oithona nana genome sequencing.